MRRATDAPVPAPKRSRNAPAAPAEIASVPPAPPPVPPPVPPVTAPPPPLHGDAILRAHGAMGDMLKHLIERNEELGRQNMSLSALVLILSQQLSSVYN